MTELLYHTRVRVYGRTGTIQDPDGALGQPDKGNRPNYDAVWVHYDESYMSGNLTMMGENYDGSTRFTQLSPFLVTGVWAKREEVEVIE